MGGVSRGEGGPVEGLSAIAALSRLAGTSTLATPTCTAASSTSAAYCERSARRAEGRRISANLGGSRLEAVGEESGREDVAAHASELLAAAPKMLTALEASLAKHDRRHCLRVCSPRLHYCSELVVNLRSASLTPPCRPFGGLSFLIPFCLK